MSLIHSFKPIIDKNCNIIILGSIPGRESLRRNQYYGHSRNHFWKIIYSLCGVPFEENYEKRTSLLLEKGIALWDVIDDCYREGSLDSNIKEAKVNNFKQLFTDYPNIKYVFFNGTKAFELFRKKVGFDFEDIVFKKLKSTSPANAIKFEVKLDDWKVIKDCIKD